MSILDVFRSFGRKSASSIDDIIRRLDMLQATAAGIAVTPDNCEESPTVQAIVNAVSARIASLSIHVEKKTMLPDGREEREQLPRHPVALLLRRPNHWQTPVEYWLDATSTLVRHGRYCAAIARGATGPIRELLPLHPSKVDITQDDQWRISVRVTNDAGGIEERDWRQVHIVRGRATDFLNGDSPVVRAREAIALEIAAQRFGATYFGNGAMPGLIFSYAEGVRGHLSVEQREAFLAKINQVFGRGNSFRALMLPAGISKPEQLTVENDRAQFLETRRLQRSVIAGAFGIPPHLVGDLDRATFSNIESQSREFVEKVILPYVRMFETAMERDLLTDEDRRAGVVIRFNLDSALRADFLTRQQGLKIQREMGVISANEWREEEYMNPRPGGDQYWDQGPSGQGRTEQDDADKDAQLPA